MNPDQKAIITKKIIDNLDWQRMTDNPKQYQFVATGIQTNNDPTRRLGYCVQIRKKIGAFGSDQVFLRHANGELMVHENQCFIGLTDEQEDLVQPIFDFMPKEEGCDETYTCCDKITATGFIIEGLELSKMARSSIMTVTEQDGDITIKTIS